MSGDEYEELPSTFAAACRRADEKRRCKRVDPAIERVRRLMDNDKPASITALHAAFDRDRGKYGAADWTIEALMFSLRERGTAALVEPDTRRRISELNEKQLAAVGARLQGFKPHIAAAWSPASVAQLVATWKAVRA
jgi:hypothetical protein